MAREELLRREDEAWQRFVETVSAVPADRRGVEGVVPGWTVHDLVWHVGYWAGFAGEVIERDRAGETDPEPTEPEEAEVLEKGRAMSWDEVVGRAEECRDRVRAAFSSSPDPGDVAVRWFNEDTFDHYDEHAAEIRAFVA